MKSIKFLLLWAAVFGLALSVASASLIHLRSETIDSSQRSFLPAPFATEIKTRHAERVSASFMSKLSRPEVSTKVESLLAKLKAAQHGEVQVLFRHFEGVEDLIAKGLKAHYVPDAGYIALVGEETLNMLNDKSSFVSHLKPEMKTLLDLQDRPRNTYFDAPTTKETALARHMEATVTLVVEVHHTRMVDVWAELAHTTFGDNVEVIKVNDRRVVVHAGAEDAGTVLEFLKHQEAVMWVERKLEFEIKNIAGHVLTQTGPSGEQNPSTPIWDKGLTGRNQIVGVGDTGIDWDNCFFNDPRYNNVPVNTVDPTRRKIISYNTVTVDKTTTDTMDDVNGHGTHVSGSVAGGVPGNVPDASSLARYNGSAPEAKLFFTDLQKSGDPRLYIPTDLQAGYFGPAYEGGARIHSNSWGCSAGIVYCRFECDCRWAVTIPGLTKAGEPSKDSVCKALLGGPCCSACNGYSSQAGDIDAFVEDHDDMLIIFAAGNDGAQSSSNSVGSPATAKNSLAIGAAHTTNQNFLNVRNWTDWGYMQEAYGMTEQECCSFNYPSSAYVQDQVRASCCPSYALQTYSNKNIYNARNVASFSSRGPTADGRIKPEIVAPGHVVNSMHSDGNTNTFNCGFFPPQFNNSGAILSMSGTSMATPTAAGAAALVRQYLTEGFYPSGKATPADTMPKPPASLMKAMIIHSAARPADSKVVRGDNVLTPVGAFPNNVTGYGFMNLSSVLRFSDSKFDLVLEHPTMPKSNNQQRFCFYIRESGEFKATLAWTDPSAAPNAGKYLVNDLDLTIFSGSDRIYGNFFEDHINNVEQAWTTVKRGDNVYVVVSGYRMQSNQNYSLVVTGNFERCEPIKSAAPTDSNHRTTTIVSIVMGSIACVGVVLAVAGVAVWRRKASSETQPLLVQ